MTTSILVDDEPALLTLLLDLLEAEGYITRAVADARGLYRALRDLRPDLFLLDIMLPGASGIELAEELHARGYRTTPMFAMSASRRMARLAADSGLFREVLVKPFDVFDFLASVERQLRAVAAS